MQGIKIKARLVKAVAFLLLTVLIIGNLGEVFALKHETYEANNYYSFDYLYDIPKDTLDVVYIGTSQYHMGITPLEIWKEYGITGASFNSPSCRAWLAYYMMQEVLKYQSPKVVMIDAAILRGGNNYIAGNRRMIGQFRPSFMKFQALYDCLDLKGKSIDQMINTSFEFFAYHDKWDTRKEEDFTDDVSSLNYQKGYSLLTNCVPYSDMNHKENRKATMFSIDDRSLDYMERIKKLCDEKEIKLIVAKLPSDMWNNTYARYVGDWAEENDADYLDLTQRKLQREMGFDRETSYFDNNHLNYIGAETVSKYLGSYLTQNYQFESHSQKIEDAWQADYDKYEKYRNNKIMQSTNDLVQFLEMADNQDYIICMSIKDDAVKGLTEDELVQLEKLGLNMRFVNRYRGSLVAVIDDGEIISQKDGTMALSCEYKPYENCEIKVESAGYNAGNYSSVVINGKEYSKNQRGINIVVYDKTTDDVICSTVFDTWLNSDER